MVFTQIARTDTSPKRWAESAFEWLDRSARPSVHRVRSRIEGWLSRYPEEGRPDLIARIRSAHDSQHEGALFELLLHELLCRLGCSVQLHPELPGTSRRPDFLGRSPKGHEFLLEATVTMDRADAAAESRLSDLRDTLDLIRSEDILFDLRYDGLPTEPVPGRKIRKRIERDLRDEDIEALRELVKLGEWGAMPSWEFEFPGIQLEITAFPVSQGQRDPDSGRAVGTIMPGVQILQTDEALSTAIRRKAGRYGDPPYPYIVAVNSLGDFPPDNIDVFNALLGKEALELGLAADGTSFRREVRRPNGVWYGPRGIQNQRVSGVLIGRGLHPWTLESSLLELILNPWARREYQCELTALDRWVPEEDDAFHREQGLSLRELFEIPSGWPSRGDDEG